MGYIQTAVNISEGDGLAQLTVAISMPPEADPIESSFILLVNTLDGTAIDLPGLPSLNLYNVVLDNCRHVFTGQGHRSSEVFLVQYQADNTTSSIYSDMCLLQ